MTHLKNCPHCCYAAKQRGGPNSFVTCGDKECPISRLSIPVQAWQSWPRVHTPSVTLKQRAQEIERLQRRLEKFGDVEAQNQQLLQQTAETKLALQSANDKCRRLEQNLNNVMIDRDAKKLELEKLTDWAVGGAKVAWATSNDSYARFFEEALDLLGKRDASKVPCGVCSRLPFTTLTPDDTSLASITLKCYCGVATYTAPEWLRKQRDAKMERQRAAPDGTSRDRQFYLDNIARVRKAINGGTKSERLLADQAELLLYIAEQLKGAVAPT